MSVYKGKNKEVENILEQELRDQFNNKKKVGKLLKRKRTFTKETSKH